MGSNELLIRLLFIFLIGSVKMTYVNYSNMALVICVRYIKQFDKLPWYKRHYCSDQSLDLFQNITDTSYLAPILIVSTNVLYQLFYLFIVMLSKTSIIAES